MSSLFRISLLLTLLLNGAAGFAQNKLVTNLSLFYFDQDAVRNVQNNNSQGTEKTQTSYTFLGLGVCYAWDALCVGIKYVQDDMETKSNGLNGDDKVLSRIKGLGLSVGYTSDTLVAQAVWMVDASKTVDPQNLGNYGGNGSASVVFPAKSAYLIDIGYGFKVASVRIGPLLSVMNFTYAKAKYEGTTYTMPKNESDNFIVPQLAIWMDI